MALGLAEPIVWPNTAQYKRALQRPDRAFSDPELRRAQLDTDVMGTPACVEGQSAVVFFGQTDNGKVTVRCLKRPVAFGERRYAALHSYLADREAVPLATVDWQTAGVSVDGRRWPIVRMEHVDGLSMRQYVSRNLRADAAIQALGERWRELAAELGRHNLAHGDLQQDNVRVLDGGRLRLIDLDAVWAPPLSEMPPREYGHRHFQHPERLRTGHWDAAVDAFSALVIYVSLKAIAADPTLWDHHHNDENLILTDADFENPGKTPIWAQLAASRDIEVRDLTPLLEQFCKQTVRVEIDLATMLSARTIPGGAIYVPTGARLPRLSAWWVDGTGETPLPGQPGVPERAAWWPGQASGTPSAATVPSPSPSPTGVVDQWPYGSSAQPGPPPGASSDRRPRRPRRVAVLAVICLLLFARLLLAAATG